MSTTMTAARRGSSCTRSAFMCDEKISTGILIGSSFEAFELVSQQTVKQIEETLRIDLEGDPGIGLFFSFAPEVGDGGAEGVSAGEIDADMHRLAADQRRVDHQRQGEGVVQ